MNRPAAILAALAAAILAAPLNAGAWTQPQGHGQVIVSGLYSKSMKGYDARGRQVDIPDYTKAEAYALAEYGVTDRLTLMVNPSLRHVEVEDGDDTSGLGYTELGARYRLNGGDRIALSVQGTARIPGARRRDSLAQVGSTDEEYDLRGLAGVPFKLGRTDAFIDVQGAYRLRAGAPPNEVRADVTLGIRPTPKLLVMAQSFNSWSDGAGRGVFTRYRYHNAYLSGVVEVGPRVSLQLGGLATVGGENALRERGLLAGIWYRF